jgi:hypothetical protein
MNCRRLWLLILIILATTLTVSAQVELKTGSIYGKVMDEKGSPLPGVLIALESDAQPDQTATSGSNGSFRFANLTPGDYTSTFSLQGFMEVKQENIQIHTGSQVELSIVMKESLTEEVVVVAGVPPLDTKKSGNFEVYSQEYLQKAPTAHDPWSLIDQTPGVDTNRYQITQQGRQASFTARGARPGGTFAYDGTDLSDPIAVGASSTYYDFDALEEIQINTTGGISINMVTKRAGNRWAANASYYYSSDSLQASNTPGELVALGLEDKSNRMDEVTEYGFDVGGPLVKDKLFVWGAYRKYDLNIFTITNLPDSTQLKDFNFKTNLNWNSSHESQFNYFLGTKDKSGFGFNPAIQAPETLWDQEKSSTILPGVWSGQHTWIPNDHLMLTARYAYVGLGFQIVSRGGTDVPVILLSSIPRIENTWLSSNPNDRPTHDVSVDLNYFKEGWVGGDHEFKFGFNYRTVEFHTFSSYGNGVFISDSTQTVPGGPLTSGYLYAEHGYDRKGRTDHVNFLVNDTFRAQKLTLNLGLRFDHSTGKNLPSSIGAVPGFESVVPAFDYPGGDPGIVFNTFSPQIGATYDLTGDGKTLIRGNYGRTHDIFTSELASYSNPAYTANGAIFSFINGNSDRTITPDEVNFLGYYGEIKQGVFDLDAYLAKNLYDKDLHPGYFDEFILGVEREIISNLSVAVTYTHRNYRDHIKELPFGVTADDYVPRGTFNATTPLGTFSVPYFGLTSRQNGTRILSNLDGYKQDYDGVDFAVRKRMSQSFLLNSSFTLQRERAHYEGGNALGETGRSVGAAGALFPFDPGLTPFLEGQPYLISTLGLYSEWQLKVGGVYQLPWNLSVGGSLKYRQGYPYVLIGRVLDPSFSAYFGTAWHLLLVEPYGSRRYDNVFMLDLQFEKSLDMAQAGQLALLASVFNVTNENTVIQRQNLLTTSTFNRIEEHLVPRIWRLGLRYSF